MSLSTFSKIILGQQAELLILSRNRTALSTHSTGIDVSRIAIKIPFTWDGMMACHTLELAGVRILATTLFSMAQAVLAAKVGCTYVAPYVNELKVQVNARCIYLPRVPFLTSILNIVL